MCHSHVKGNEYGKITVADISASQHSLAAIQTLRHQSFRQMSVLARCLLTQRTGNIEYKK